MLKTEKVVDGAIEITTIETLEQLQNELDNATNIRDAFYDATIKPHDDIITELNRKINLL